MSGFELVALPVLSDNYVWLARLPDRDFTAVVDPSLDAPTIEALEARGWRADMILLTHHHHDHVGGVAGIKAHFGSPVVAPAAERRRIAHVDIWVEDGDTVEVGDARARVIAVPGHTSGHVAFHVADEATLFCGDTLFSLGCGRLFEGTPAQMWHSLSRLAALPGDTLVCCAHEYTAANGRFALSVEPGNAALAARMEEVAALRAAGRPTLPSTIAGERATNPFLRPDSPEIRERLGMAGAADVEVFAELRRRKDNF